MNRKAAMNEASERKGEEAWALIIDGMPHDWYTTREELLTEYPGIDPDNPEHGDRIECFVPASSLSIAVAGRDSAVRARDSYHARVFELIAECDAFAAKLVEATKLLRMLPTIVADAERATQNYVTNYVGADVMNLVASKDFAAFLHDPKEGGK